MNRRGTLISECLIEGGEKKRVHEWLNGDHVMWSGPKFTDRLLFLH